MGRDRLRAVVPRNLVCYAGGRGTKFLSAAESTSVFAPSNRSEMVGYPGPRPHSLRLDLAGGDFQADC